MQKRTNLTNLLLVLILYFVGSGRMALAQSPARFQMQPITTSRSERKTDFVYSVDAGAIFEDAVELKNIGESVITLSIYHAPANTANNGGVNLLGADAPASETSLWLTFPPLMLTLAPSESRTLPFQVEIPADTPSGEYMTGIVAEVVSETSETPTGLAVEFVQRAAVPMLFKVGEPASADMRINTLAVESDNGSQIILAELANTGDVGVKPSGVFSIHDGGGALVHQQDVRLGYVIAKDNALMKMPLSAEIPANNYRLTLMLDIGGKQVQKVVDQTITSPTPIPTITPTSSSTAVPTDAPRTIAPPTTTPQSTSTPSVPCIGDECEISPLLIGFAFGIVLLVLSVGLMLLFFFRQRKNNPQLLNK